MKQGAWIAHIDPLSSLTVCVVVKVRRALWMDHEDALTAVTHVGSI